MTATPHAAREHWRRASEMLARAEARTAGAAQSALAQKLSEIARAHLGAAHAQAPDEATQRQAQSALASAWRTIGELLALQGDKRACIDAYRACLQLAPDDIAAHARMAELLESRHDLDAAEAHAKRALGAEPHNLIAGLAMARVLLRRRRFAEAERAALAAAEAPQASADGRALAWSLAGEARDRGDDAARAFAAFARANQIMRRAYGAMDERHHPAHPLNVRHLTRFIDHMRVEADRSFVTPAPAFLIGFPRSGTTLLEQVLAAHPDVVCLGETDHLFEAFSVVLKDGDLLERVNNLRAGEIEIIRAAYQRFVLRDHPGATGKLIIDKHPLHITLLPLINKVFPDAKIILSLRDPRDVVLSCFQQCFGMNVATAQFLELDRAAAYFDAVMELLLAARAKLKLNLHQVEYADVVADLEHEARAMAAFLELPFDAAMLRFNETAQRRAISSASARQVIEPIYARSAGRWRRYADDLSPVLPLLDKWARRLGYEE